MASHDTAQPRARTFWTFLTSTRQASPRGGPAPSHDIREESDEFSATGLQRPGDRATGLGEEGAVPVVGMGVLGHGVVRGGSCVRGDFLLESSCSGADGASARRAVDGEAHLASVRLVDRPSEPEPVREPNSEANRDEG